MTSPTRAHPASLNEMISATTLPTPQLQSHGGWSKANLHQSECRPWTRTRDGWGVLTPKSVVNYILTFSLAPGWTFVPTEGWRKDRAVRWALNPDPESRLCSDVFLYVDGWVYTNDAWNDARPLLYQSSNRGCGCLTRRCRWVRVWCEGGRMIPS